MIAALFTPLRSVGIAVVIGPRQFNRAKLSRLPRVRHRTDKAEPVGQRFPIKYYLTAMLFIVFDIEIVFPLSMGCAVRQARGSSRSSRC